MMSIYKGRLKMNIAIFQTTFFRAQSGMILARQFVYGIN